MKKITRREAIETIKRFRNEEIGNIHDNPDLIMEKNINIFKCEM